MAQKSYLDKAGATKLVENIKAIEADIYSEIDKKANASHTHAIADVTGLQTKLDQLDNKVEYDTLYDLTASTGSSNGAVTIDLKSGGTSSIASETDSIHINGSGATSVTTDAVGTITIDSTDTTYNVVTTSTEGLMAPSDKEKLDGIDYNANNYVLPVAGNSDIGGVLSGGDITVDSGGMVTVNNDSHTHGAGTITSVNASAIEGVISEANLPSYVDDVLEYDTKSAFPATGESGKIYVALDTNLTYRWGGSGYVEISPSIALGETSSTAYRGDYGAVAYAHATAKGNAYSSGLYKIATNAEGHVTSATAVAKSDITSLGISGAEHTHNYAGSSSAGGAATSANKLSAARTIGLSGGVTGTATSFDGSGDISIPVTEVKEAYLSWGGKNFSGAYGPIDAAMIPDLGANRFAFMPPEGINIEYSTNGGSTWSNYSTNDTGKINLFNGVGYGYSIGASSASGIDKTNYQLRVTITTDVANVYTMLNKFVIYCSTNGSSGCWCTIDAKTKANVDSGTDTWVTFANKSSISGWSGYNIINTSGITTYGNSSSQYQKLRFTFGVNSHASSVAYGGLMISKIMGFGGAGWTTPSVMAKNGHMYEYDASQNVSFPAGIYATSFNGNLSGNADTATNATSLATVTTAGDGAAYTATVDGIDSLTAGVNFLMLPHTQSTTVSPTLNVNGLGAKALRQQLTNSTSSSTSAASTNWLGANKPVRVTYNGIFWVADLVRPTASTLYGTTAIANGGTGADNAADARINLGIETTDGTTTSGNADYAEVGEWADGNTADEDRIGYFVAIDDSTSGKTIVKANSLSDVRGVTVVAPAFSGNCSSDKYETETTTETDPDTGEEIIKVTSTNLKKQYDYVAVMGMVSVIDNGTCTINGRCMPTDDGTAVPSPNNMGYQVIDRIDSTHILIAVEPGADMLVRIKEDVGELQAHVEDTTIHLPAYTSADEGKFLRIVNGVPAWVSIENAEGVSF